ncbi:MAG: hypothetical protein LBR39_08140 [Coriobacteriales bacterium]|nr:hypothetical protein [Coriobacteriales bacterium]
MAAAKPARKKKTKLIIGLAAAAVLVIVGVLLTFTVILPAIETSNAYKDAVALMDAGEYKKAKAAFKELGDYKDSADLAKQAQQYLDYQSAEALFDEGDYEAAKAAFDDLGSFKDSKDRATESQNYIDYDAAQQLLNDKQWADAKEAFDELGDFKDSADKAALAQQHVDYNKAVDYYQNGNFKSAQPLLKELGDFEDAKAMLQIVEDTLAFVYTYELSYVVIDGYSVTVSELAAYDIQCSLTIVFSNDATFTADYLLNDQSQHLEGYFRIKGSTVTLYYTSGGNEDFLVDGETLISNSDLGMMVLKRNDNTA